MRMKTAASVIATLLRLKDESEDAYNNKPVQRQQEKRKMIRLLLVPASNEVSSILG